MTELDFSPRSNSPKVTKKSLYWVCDLTIVSMETDHADNSAENHLDGNIELREWDPMLESQIFKQARKKSGAWLSKFILIFFIFYFHPISLLPVRKNDST